MNQNESEHEDIRIKTGPVLVCSVNPPASLFEQRGCPSRVMDTVPCPGASGGQTPQSCHHGCGKSGICPPVQLSAGFCGVP